jgi:3-oxoacyl-[acyl-carrier protein] reductase
MRQTSVAIVTGASQGIGRSAAIRLAKDFSAVALVARNGDALTEVAEAVRSAGAEPLSIPLDLSRVESPDTVVKTTLDRYCRVDALLNIAGAVPQIDLFEMTDEQWYAGMELKLHGARRLTIRTWDALKANQGSVVFMSGSAALDPNRALPRWQPRTQPSSLWRRLLQSRGLRTACK